MTVPVTPLHPCRIGAEYGNRTAVTEHACAQIKARAQHAADHRRGGRNRMVRSVSDTVVRELDRVFLAPCLDCPGCVALGEAQP